MPKTHSDMRVTRARWLRRIREDRRLTQAKLAQKVGVTINAISQFENGRAEPSLDTHDRLVTALEIWPVDLRENLDLPVPPRRPARDQPNGAAATSIQLVIDEFREPSLKPQQYPLKMRCWICHGRPGECQCYTFCKVCGLPFPKGCKCSGKLH